MEQKHFNPVADQMESVDLSQRQRPSFPKRAVVTAGMPYGEKQLHFGHVGGMFVHADVFARFLRDRLGPENVIFVSGTDCYGSGIEIKHRELVEQGEFQGTREEFVARNHAIQKKTLEAYDIIPNLYAASALGKAGEIHAQLSKEVFDKLYAEGALTLMETKQFYDEENQAFLNGRQVQGRCPIQGCKSEIAYADECALGHQYSPEELIQPISVRSGKAPALKTVGNWCLDMERFHGLLMARQDILDADEQTRRYLISVIGEFLRPPMIYIKKEAMEELASFRDQLPPYTIESEEQKASDALVFETLAQRAEACTLLDAHHIRYRTGKTLVPFRLTGNSVWGIPVPEQENIAGLTFWVWPESLWAPISFTKAYLQEQGAPADAWKQWWATKDAQVFQFIGEDNIYFYSVAQTGLFLALQGAENRSLDPVEGTLRLTTVVPNRHLLYGKRKASSSGAEKPPTADELLTCYTKEQLRMHFFHMNLGINSVGFTPHTLLHPEQKGQYDPVLYEGNILTNIYNRLIRSCFYSLQKYFEGHLPQGEIRPEALTRAQDLILSYESAMHRFEFGKTVDLLDSYLRECNKIWASETKAADQADDNQARAQILLDSFHAVRLAATLLHPMAPEGTEMVRAYLNIGPQLWDWANIFQPLSYFMADEKTHEFRFLEPRVDFFAKHPAQLG